jgi:hypothetical protein
MNDRPKAAGLGPPAPLAPLTKELRPRLVVTSATGAWGVRLEELRRRTAGLRRRSRWSVEWAIYRWATERLASAAIRIDGSEGLSGPAPARWRLLTHIDPDTSALALAVLDGRARLIAGNVVASMLSSEDEAVVAVRGGGVRRWERPKMRRSSPRGGIDLSIDIALERRAGSPDLGADADVSQAHELALALALHELHASSNTG